MAKPTKNFILGPKFTPKQWTLFGKSFANISQAIIIFSAAAFFVPETVSLSNDFSRLSALTYFLFGLFLLYGSGIIIEKGK